MNGGAVLDTNILTASRDESYSHHSAVNEYLSEIKGTTQLLVAPQSLYEFWVVATRPRSANGLEMTPKLAWREVSVLRRLFNVLPDPQHSSTSG